MDQDRKQQSVDPDFLSASPEPAKPGSNTADSNEPVPSVTGEVLRSMTDAIGPGLAIQTAIADRGLLATTAGLTSMSSAMTEILKDTSGLTGANSALRAALAAQGTLAAAAAQNLVPSITGEVLRSMTDAIRPGSAIQTAITDRGLLATTAGLTSMSSAMTEILENTSGLTGANSALRAALAAQGTLAAAGVSNSISRAMSEIVRDSIGAAGLQRGIQSALRRTDLPLNANTLAALHAVSAGDLTSETDARFVDGWRDGARAEKYFKSIAPSEPAEPAEPVSADKYFSEDEGDIKSLADLHIKIERLVVKNPGLALVWRGHQNASWGLHSNLFRALTATEGERSPKFPSEDQMVEAEKNILRTAREEWRLNDMSAVEVFARLQHFGAPTRLIDVSRNPLIAAWFAVEAGSYDDEDGRLIALATGPVPKEPNTSMPALSLSANDLSQAGGPVWHEYLTVEERRGAGWGTGGNRLVWIPSAYEERISAQNAGFVLDGIPIVSTEVLSYFESDGGHSLRASDLLAAGSIYVHTQKTTRKAKHSGPAFAPTFTFRIPKEVKIDIRTRLESQYSLTRGTIYPDMAGLARYVAADFGESNRSSAVS